MSANGYSAVEKVKDTIYRSCLLLDDENWADWLDLCGDDFKYKITSYSPEIRKDMTYQAGNREELKSMTRMLPKHNTDHSPLKRHVSVYTVDLNADDKTATAISSFVVYQNMLDGINSHIDAGENRLFMVGRYIDTLTIDGDIAKFVEREVRLDTRRLDKGSHYVI